MPAYPAPPCDEAHPPPPQLLRGPGGEAGVARWAPLGAGGASALARALCRALAVPEALQVVGSLCWGASAGGGSPGSSSAVPRLSFGYVVRCPHCAQQSDDPQVQPPSLSLVQPQEGLQRCACARCGYDFELFSGTVRSASSQAVAPGAAPDQGGPLAQLRRALRLDPSVAAVHELEVATPCGTLVRAYRVGTRGPEVPAAVGQRVSVACAAPESLEGVGGAQRSKRERSALGRLLPPRPPRTRAGQALDLSNQATGAVTPLLVPPPPPGVPSDFDPSRLLPTLLLLAAAADGASALVDPALPALLLTGGAVSLAGAAAADALLLPRLARLPAAALSLEAQRQGLLQQHSALSAQAAAQAVGCGEDVRALARLWQLQSKMESVNDPQLYAQRLTRVKAARGALEARLDARMALLERYARVATLIEIEIECEGEELRGAQQGIELEMAALEEAQQVTEVWRNAAAAADEVERLLAG